MSARLTPAQRGYVEGAMIRPQTGLYSVLWVDPNNTEQSLRTAFTRSRGTDPTWVLRTFRTPVYIAYTFEPQDVSTAQPIPDDNIQHYVLRRLGFPQRKLYDAVWMCVCTHDQRLESLEPYEFKIMMSLYVQYHDETPPSPAAAPPVWAQ